ncbi:hypothetical protein KY289_011828 [Solanum tuberosum]|nr:hypothetical protein KY289_011828 [Solanum tuberosum]
MWRICTGMEEDGVEASKKFHSQEKELFAIQYDFLIMKVKSSSLMLMLALFRSWEKLAILIQHSQLFERWDTFRYGPIHCLVRLPAGCCLCFVIASHIITIPYLRKVVPKGCCWVIPSSSLENGDTSK